jgi:uncharacterized membrane protein
MSPTLVLLLAFLIGAVAGLRSLTSPATVAWGLHLHWLTLPPSRLAYMGSTAAVIIFTLLAAVELVLDILPTTPSRTAPAGLITRIFTGGLAGAVVAGAGGQSVALGITLGIVGAVLAAYAGEQVRTRLVKALKCPDFVVAILEDAVAIGGGLFIVSRF